MARVKELVEEVAKALVDQPDQVQVTESGSGPFTKLELRVAPGDVGKVIGRQGRTARSLRSLLNAAGAKANKRVALDIAE